MKNYLISLIIATVFIHTSCNKLLDVENTNAINLSEHYNDYNDADRAIMGIYGKFMGLVDRVIVLNELRGDLMYVTENATQDLVEINNHTASPSNYYCDMRPFYEIIINCNDVLANFDKMKAEKRLTDEGYSYRYADVMTVRCWVYLQLAIHFGALPYVTKPFVTVDDLKNPDFCQMLTYDEMLVELANDMRSLPEASLDVSISSPLFDASSSATDQVNLKLMLLNKHFVFGDILLYGNQYVEAAKQYLRVIEDAEESGWTNVGSTTVYKARKGADRFDVSSSYFYISYLTASTTSEGYGCTWNNMFMLPSTDRTLAAEMINIIEYQSKLAQKYPLIELFAPTGRGKYLLKPSKQAMDVWNSQEHQGNRNTFDGRGDGSAFTVMNDGRPVVIKYLYDYFTKSNDGLVTTLDFNSVVKNASGDDQMNGKWFLYRTGLLHLRYAEAANRAGYPDLADALLQRGVTSKYNAGNAGSSGNVKGVQYSGGLAVQLPDPQFPNETYWYRTPYHAPFYLDGRSNAGGNANKYDEYSSPWSQNPGLRNRAYVQMVSVPRQAGDPPFSHNDSIRWMEETLLAEAALECGFEGFRWGDLLRIARRKNLDAAGEGTAFLNDLLRKKFDSEGKEAPPVITDFNLFLNRRN